MTVTRPDTSPNPWMLSGDRSLALGTAGETSPVRQPSWQDKNVCGNESPRGASAAPLRKGSIRQSRRVPDGPRRMIGLKDTFTSPATAHLGPPDRGRGMGGRGQ